MALANPSQAADPLGQGNVLAFASTSFDGSGRLYILDDAHGLRQLVGGDAFILAPAWSPESQRLGFRGYDPNRGTTRLTICFVETNQAQEAATF